MKVFLHSLGLLYLTLLILLSVHNPALASPKGGYVINEKTKLCTETVVGDEYGDVNLGDCKEKVFNDNNYLQNPKSVCEAHGYTFTSGDIKTFCKGVGVGSILSLTFLPYILILLAVISLVFIFYISTHSSQMKVKK